MTDVLGRAVIEVGVDDMRLQDELGQSQRTMSNSFAASLNRTKLTVGEMQKLSVLNRDLRSQDMSRVKLGEAQVRTTMKLASATKWHAEMAKKLASMSLGERQKARGGTLASTMPGFGEKIGETGVASGIMKLLGIGGAALGGASAMTFAGAAAAGSTTLDTLTGSLKMLSLAAGQKTQAGVLKISEYIQRLARSANEAPSGTIGGLSGAATGGLIGLRFGGLLGAAGGAIAGGLGGGLIEKGANDFAEKRSMVAALKADPDKTIKKLLNEINDLEKPWYSGIPFIGNSVEIGKRRGAIRTFEAKLGGQQEGGLKTAGLNIPASYSALGDVRQQAQIAATSKGPLEMENFQKEMLLNLKAIANNTAPAGTKQAAANVQPPP
jgi:hypothetical protein